MRKRAMHTHSVKILLLLFIIFLMISCDRHFYNGNVAVQQHAWQLKQIDTLYAGGKYKPSARWYNRFDRVYYVDNDHEFPYPFTVGDYIFNFDRK